MRLFRPLVLLVRLFFYGIAALFIVWIGSLCLVIDYKSDPAHASRNNESYNPRKDAKLGTHLTWVAKQTRKNLGVAKDEFSYGYKRQRDRNNIASKLGAKTHRLLH